MNTLSQLFPRSVWTIAATLLLVPVVSAAQTGRVTFPSLEHLASKATNNVNVTLDAGLLKLAAAFMDEDDEDEVAVRALMQGLEGIYVRSLEFGAAGAYTSKDVDEIVRQVTAPGWSRVVDVKDQNGEAVGVFVRTQNDKPIGIVVLAQEPKKLTIVNLVGFIDLAKLGALRGQFGIPKVELPGQARGVK